MSGRRSTTRRSPRSSAAAAAAAATAATQPNGGGGGSSSSAPSAAAPAPAPTPTPTPTPAVNGNGGDDAAAEEEDASNGGSTSPDAGAGSGSGGGGGGGGDEGSGGGEVEARQRGVRNRGGATANKRPPRSVHPNRESSDRWFTNTHIAMVGILAELFNDLEERYSTTYGQDPVVDDAVLGFIQRIKDIGQAVTVFTVSRLQTHSLISNTVQLCHRMAGDQHSQLAKDYPSVGQVEYDTYDQSTDDGGRVLEDDDSDDDDDDEAWGGRDQRARSPAGGSVEGTGASGEGGGGGENGAVASNPAKRRKRSSGGGSGGDGGGGASSSRGAADGGGAHVGEEVEEGFEDMALSSAGKGKKKKGKGKPGKSKRGGSSSSSSSSSSGGVGDSGGDQGAGAGVENGAKKVAKEREGEARKEEVVAGHMVRERYHAVVIKLVARSKWASEPAGRAHKDVITRAREVIMTIFIDSFHRRLLSLHRLVTSLDQLDRMIAWADDVEEGVNAKEAGVLGPGMPMSEIGLTNIALTVPE